MQGIGPEGWHIPAGPEWKELIAGLGGNTPYREMLVGCSSGFDALLTGYRCTMSARRGQALIFE